MHRLGRDYVVWDKASRIDYRLPGRGTVRATFRINPREAIAAEGYDTITPVVICNAEEFGKLTTTTGRVAAVGDRIIGLQKK